MNVVRLFPEKETPEIEQIPKSPARTERGLRRGLQPAQPSPVDVLARAAGGRRAASPLTPDGVTEEEALRRGLAQARRRIRRLRGRTGGFKKSSNIKSTGTTRVG